MDNDTRTKLVNLRKLLRWKATNERKKIGNETTRLEGQHKGMWLAFEESATLIDRLLRT